MNLEIIRKHIASQSTLLFIITVLLLIYSCNSKEKQEEKHFVYKAVNANKDTALLSLTINKNRFYGQYEIKYGKAMKDSGSVKGDIVGDTLFKGDYNYLSYGGGLKIIPIALLKKENKLFLGNGVISTYLGIPCFIPDVPISYTDSEFIFEEVK
ncbi:hypothetical protein LNQ49_01535 [Flavobacterium sp. F-65]|jgi:hypothetical protein|uniref:Lipoprotein n=1 Tax=Flavobacterium pisciphilum TaxID=2893755 RepID=A0ABS8MNG6_9FLAO|nr:hypothetical protein [Flavobacterium sp. F-65]MCC9070285.1 hypothetical protein [Flavobacterium sp. F-65]